MPSFRLLAGFFLLSAWSVSAQVIGGTGVNSANNCGWASQCSSGSPCCGEYGKCGSGVTCLVGCNPHGSFNASYCAPAPVCVSKNYTFTSMDRIQRKLEDYKGNASEYDWIIDQVDSQYDLVADNTLGLRLSKLGGGTRVLSTRNVLYGSITASIKTIGAKGVVTAFITMSGVKDEIDWEWTGTNMSEAQTNFYWQGVTGDFVNGRFYYAANRDTQYHIYGLDWTPTTLSWTIDGQTVRTLRKSDSLFAHSKGLYEFPSTPSQIQMAVWPAGIPGGAAGTVEWAGGMIDWNDPLYTSKGYYEANIAWINVNCYPFANTNLTLDSTSNGTVADLSSYVYGKNDSFGQIEVFGSAMKTVITSTKSNGMNMEPEMSPFEKFWEGLATPARIGIIVGISAGVLFLLVACCSCIVRARDRRKRAALKGAGAMSSQASLVPGNVNSTSYGRRGQDQSIPLVEKPGGFGAGAYQRQPKSGFY